MGNRRHWTDVVRITRECAKAERIQYTRHAQTEMWDDNVEPHDVRRILLTGRLSWTLTHDPRGARYVVEAKTEDGRQTAVVCRLVGDLVRVVTVYVL